MDRFLFHSPLHYISAVVNQGVVALLQDKGTPSIGSGGLGELQACVRTAPAYIPGPHESESSQKFLGIIPTRQCNLNCVYCGFSSGRENSRTMDFGAVAAAIDWMAEYICQLPNSNKLLDVHFFGGEPFLARDVIEVALHRTRLVAARSGLIPHFEASTNGFFSEEYISFIGDYFDTIVLSLDGPRELHDRHRSRPQDAGGSFDTVVRNALLLGQRGVKLCLRCCVTEETVSRLEEITGWFCETLQPAVINFETLQPTPESKAAGLQPPDPYEFALHFVRARQLAEKYGIPMVYPADLTSYPRSTFCPVGGEAFILSPDGRISVCYLPPREWQARNLDMDVGLLENNARMNINPEKVKHIRQQVHQKPRCENCFCRWSCAGGCHVNHSYPGCLDQYDDFCIQTRLITACSLLEETGETVLLEQLLNNPAMQRKIACRKSDVLNIE